LPHGEQLTAISRGVNAARVGRLAGIAQIFFLAPVFREIGQSIKTADGDAGNCGEAGAAVLVYVYSRGRTYRVLGSFLERGRKGVLSPGLSAADGWRFSKTSATGSSATCGLDGFFSMRTPLFCFDNREARACGQGAKA